MVSQEIKILLVDDDELSQRMMGLLMSGKGYNYDIASNGIEAIEALQSRSYDIILMDLQMPLMDGYEATTKIRSWEAGNRHTPIVALTAMLFQAEIQKCLSVGMDECISKPFNAGVLFQLIESLVNRSNKAAALPCRQETQKTDELVMLDVKTALPWFDHDVEDYRNFLKEFIAGLPERIKQIRANFLSGDFKTLAVGAHNLKGISASMGAKQLSNLSQKLDRKSQDGNPSEIQQTIEELENYVNVFQDEALEILSGFTVQ